MFLSSLRASLANQQRDRLIQDSLCYNRTSTSNHPRWSHWSTCNSPKLLPYIHNPYFLVPIIIRFVFCFRSCSMLINARPPLGARGAERGASPRGCSNSSPTLSSVTLSQLPSQLTMSSFRRQPPTMVFGSAYGRIASPSTPFCCTLKMRTSRSNS